MTDNQYQQLVEQPAGVLILKMKDVLLSKSQAFIWHLQYWDTSQWGWHYMYSTGTPPSEADTICTVLGHLPVRLTLYVQYWDTSQWGWHYMYSTGTPPSEADTICTVLGHLPVRLTLYVQYWDTSQWGWHYMYSTGSPPSEADTICTVLGHLPVRLTLYVQYWVTSQWGWLQYTTSTVKPVYNGLCLREHPLI